MSKKMTQEQIHAELKNFSEATYTKYGSYSYYAGYLESLTAKLLEQLPASRQEIEMYINQVRRSRERRRSLGNL